MGAVIKSYRITVQNRLVGCGFLGSEYFKGHSIGVFMTLLSVYDEAFYEYIKRLLTVNYLSRNVPS